MSKKSPRLHGELCKSVLGPRVLKSKPCEVTKSADVSKGEPVSSEGARIQKNSDVEEEE